MYPQEATGEMVFTELEQTVIGLPPSMPMDEACSALRIVASSFTEHALAWKECARSRRPGMREHKAAARVARSVAKEISSLISEEEVSKLLDAEGTNYYMVAPGQPYLLSPATV